MRFLYILIAFLGFNSLLHAQSTSLFVIYSDYNTNNGVDPEKEVINVDKATNKPILVTKIIIEKDNYFDSFIIRPSVDNPLKCVYIIAAHEPNLYLKRATNGDLEFKDITTETSTTKPNYEWEIQYFGYPYVAFVDPRSPKKVIYNDNKNLIVKEITQDWSIPNNNDTSANAYRFKIKKITNTF